METIAHSLPNWLLLAFFLGITGLFVIAVKTFVEEKVRQFIRKSKGRRFEDVMGAQNGPISASGESSWVDRFIESQDRHIVAMTSLNESLVRQGAAMRDITLALQGVLASQEEITRVARMYEGGEGVCRYPKDARSAPHHL